VATLYTIGHSTRALEDFLAVLGAHQIETLVDIRAFPGSRRLPQFNRSALDEALPAAGIRYLGMTALGGYRKKLLENSPHIALRNESFRNYADYMLTPGFETAIAGLVRLAATSRSACMCAERHYSHCHRKLVSDWLVAHGHQVLHLEDPAPAKRHVLSIEARFLNGQLLYRGDRLL
jgi:uncharacterized protein (DUF488 family)